jgi:hypothetical protein
LWLLTSALESLIQAAVGYGRNDASTVAEDCRFFISFSTDAGGFQTLDIFALKAPSVFESQPKKSSAMVSASDSDSGLQEFIES